MYQSIRLLQYFASLTLIFLEITLLNIYEHYLFLTVSQKHVSEQMDKRFIIMQLLGIYIISMFYSGQFSVEFLYFSLSMNGYFLKIDSRVQRYLPTCLLCISSRTLDHSCSSKNIPLTRFLFFQNPCCPWVDFLI